MRITKFGHACVRLEHDGQAVVIDPGSFTDQEAVAGATAVLVTHEHYDHLDVAKLRAADAPILTIEPVRAAIAEAAPDLAERVQVVTAGQQVDVGLPVTAVGEQHAVIHPDVPRISNTGYVVDLGTTRVYHPGDSFTPPGGPVDLLLLPISAPWSKLSEIVDFSRAVGARRSLAVHDALLSDIGLMVVDRNLSALLDTDQHAYARVQPGEDVAQ